jgi:hypothetical protein
MRLRRAAIGRECQIRLDGCMTRPCCLCHFRLIGISGMGLKPPDLIGAHGCASCHYKVDHADRDDIATNYAFALGVIRTQAILIKENGEPWK